MIAVLLGLLSVGGLGGIAFKIFGWTAIKAFGGRAATAAGRVPPKAWIALAVVIALTGSYFLHRHFVHSFKVEIQRAQMAADNDHWKKKLAAARTDALNWKQHYEQAQTKQADKERTRHEQVLRDNAAISSALRLRGPGAATSHCRPSNHTSAISSAGGSRTPPSAARPAPAQVSTGDWATVPWNWLVTVLTQHDDVTDEARAWRNDKAKQNELYQQQVLHAPSGN
jgi:hypothetical protein